MDFRVLALCWLLGLLPHQARASDPLDELTAQVYQAPTAALAQISTLEQQHRSQRTSDRDTLRTSLLKCQALLQLGENEAAINVAQLEEARAKQLKLDHVRPYFLICQADGHLGNNHTHTALPLLDAAIALAHRYQQPQALVDALRLRGQLDTEADNYASAIEDLRLAIDIYPDIHHQAEDWIWPPQAYVYATMGNLLHATKNFPQAMHYTEQALHSPDAKGKVLQVILLNAAKIALDNQQIDYSDQLEIQAKTLLPEINNPIELAYSYAILASIAFDKGRIDNAQEYITISMNTFTQQNQTAALMRANRLLAQIRFAQQQEHAALSLMQAAIALGEQLQLSGDLEDFYRILSEYYAEKGDFKAAHALLLKRFEAAKHSYEERSHARILQFKARLNQQDTQQPQDMVRAPAATSPLIWHWSYGLYMLLTLALLAMALWYFIDKQHHPKVDPESPAPTPSPLQQLEAQLSGAKQGGYPLALLLLNTSQLRHIDLAILQQELLVKLREQDTLIRYSIDEILILLPHTSNKGAQQVAEQLNAALQPWQGTHGVNFGIAALQQFDTLASLIKRASINQLGKIKGADHKQHHGSPAK
ncbi:MAG: diguanylate cyclase domain-containing protein [Shewanella sp.]|uniref:diguanylate cyclase domain-containing protein n=1 Tax=Shewanella sp. TaxID=50422 RepID=UPI003F3DB856